MTDVNNNDAANSTASPDGAGVTPSGNARLYEIVDKVTGEVFPVEKLGSGNVDNDGDMDFITHKEDGTQVNFLQPGYTNDQYVVRDRETKLSPDGVTPVPDVVPAAPEAPAAPAAAEGSEPAAEVTPSANDAVYFSVYDTVGNFVRRYSSVENVDAATAEELANKFAAKIKGTVKKG